MLSFSVPLKEGFFDFTSESRSVLFAGSRHLSLDRTVCHDLVSIFGSIGFSFLTGCADGADQSFRQALSESGYRERSIIACAFQSRVKRCFDLPAVVVSQDINPRAALARRTVWMVSTCSLLVLFPSDPIGKGSALAMRTALAQDKPVFTVSQESPAESPDYTVLPSSLFGVVRGWWLVPHACHERDLCNEQTLRAVSTYA